MFKAIFLTSISLLLFIDPAISQNESLFYNILHNGDEIGTVEVSKTVEDDLTYYHSKTEIEKKLIFKEHEIEYQFDVYFENGELKESDVLILWNGNVNTKTRIEKNGSGYDVYEGGKKSKSITNPVYHSTIMMHFAEPEDGQYTLSEKEGVYHTFHLIEENTFAKKSPNGKTNTYHYKNGKMDWAEIGNSLIEFRIELSENNTVSKR